MDMDLDALEAAAEKEKLAEEKAKEKLTGKKGKKTEEKTEVKEEKKDVKKGKHIVNGYTIDYDAPKGSVANPNTFEESPDSIVARCGNCSTTHGGQVYVTWADAIKMNEEMDPTVLKCPHCENTLGTGPYSKYSFSNPSFNPKNIKVVKK